MSAPEITDLSAAVAPRLITEVPGPEARARIERDRKVTSPSLPRAYPFVPKRGSGSVLEDVDGNLFLDLNAGIAVTSTGHAHPRVVEAIHRQADELLHYSASDFFLPIYSDVCEELDRIAPFRADARSFLTNSGTEAVEAAIKLARRATGRQYVLAMFGSFHGRSYGSVSLTASKSLYRAGFGPMLPGVIHSWFGDCAHCPLNLTYPECDFATVRYIEDVIFKHLVKPYEVAAVVVEPVLGEGGYIAPPPGWLAELRELCTRHGILLIADEVQSGMGRTGKLWAIEHFDVEPDVVLTGKGIASGMPLGAMIARHDLMVWETGAHGSTYGGNPVSCAAALATLDLIEDESLPARARDLGAWIEDRVARWRGLAGVADVRGRGLLWAVELADAEAAQRCVRAALERGLLLLTCGAEGRTLQILPPLTIDRRQLATALDLLEAALCP
jgi:4-aminobutyrate aminotransferase